LWPFRKEPHKPSFAIGRYRIDETVEAIEGQLRPLSAMESTALNKAFTFEGEEIWHAPTANFLDLTWNIMLGTVNKSIYKIVAEWTGPRHVAGAAIRQLTILCTKEYGRGTNYEAWDTSDGDILLRSTNIGDEAIMSLFMTSRKVRGFKQTSST
jgi:hypothetical protein